MQTSINLTEYYLKKRKMNNKTFNLEILEPIDFENPFIIESLIKERMLNHLNGEYHIQSVDLSLNRRDNYVLIVVVNLID
ncbi:MAG: hypothetical protein CMP13_03050 [Zunongwangia sp.]|uniref:Uncharacterized protein n=2 Tax=Flavobacteriaceae TaxID=49546 RepID=A0A3D5IYW8_9FLAO|nr:hypothetical protein [Zunongwangia sp.]HAJ80829.1 hypothetical protein [Zunongwangia profunda]HCV80893.1 hypothetical protein [Zunongwangia profunda]|tara:strand:- start:2253 stop:2492 length:240 start_codon:yes stop_codon:yes gene_type:complete